MTLTSCLDSCPRLLEVIQTGRINDIDGKSMALSSAITSSNAARLMEIVSSNGLRRGIEIGMAHGISSASILAAMSQNSGTLISLDPWEQTHWKGGGKRLVSECGFSSRHELVEEIDYFALPRILADGGRFDFAYIDGNHSFEHTFIDLFYVDRMLDVGGIVGFNDCGMPSVRRVISYLMTNLKYEAVSPISTSWWKRRKLKFWEYPDEYFRKKANYEVPWDAYSHF